MNETSAGAAAPPPSSIFNAANTTTTSRSTTESLRRSGASRLLENTKDPQRHHHSPSNLQEIVLKMTAYCEDDVATSFRVNTNGATIGRLCSSNDISVPIDKSLSDSCHASIWYDNQNFFLVDGSNNSGTYVRISSNVSTYHWPLSLRCKFRVGHNEFEVTRCTDNSLTLVPTAGKLLKSPEGFVIGSSGMTIGRSTDNGIHTGDGELSRKHASIDFYENKFYLSDVGSTNGTFMKLAGPYNNPYKLAIGDQILLGRTCFAINRFDTAVFACVGSREYMEDEYAIVQDMNNIMTKSSSKQQHEQHLSFFGVMDGHGGDQVSRYSSKHLPKVIAKELIANNDISKSLVSAFEKMDAEILEKVSKPSAGSTATTVLVVGKKLFVTNLGDSRTILCNKNGVAKRLSCDQNLKSRPDEVRRIRDTGGFIINGRIMGELSVSRAFGDISFKEFDEGVIVREDDGSTSSSSDNNIVSTRGISEMLKGPLVLSTPEVDVYDVDDDEFMVLASDGLFDVMTDDEVVQYIKREMLATSDLQRTVEALVTYAIDSLGTRDNVTAMIVALKNPTDWSS